MIAQAIHMLTSVKFVLKKPTIKDTDSVSFQAMQDGHSYIVDAVTMSS
jgi:hypothetical protein